MLRGRRRCRESRRAVLSFFIAHVNHVFPFYQPCSGVNARFNFHLYNTFNHFKPNESLSNIHFAISSIPFGDLLPIALLTEPTGCLIKR